MAPELSLLLHAVDTVAGIDAYRRAAIEENALLKPSLASRRKTFACLRDRYALDGSVPIFRVLQRLIALEPDALPQLALLVAAARDPLLRATMPLMLSRQPDTAITTDEFLHAIDVHFADRFNAVTRKAAAERIRGSWKQSGHLIGPSTKRRRAKPPVSAATITMGLVLGYACELAGESLLSSEWIAIQDVAPSTARDLAQTAARRGWIELRDAGGIFEITFRALLTTEKR